MTHEVCGTAYYNGQDPEIIKEFGRFNSTLLYNCEGWYVLDSEGKQVVCDRNWTKLVDTHKPTLNGKDINRLYVSHENIVIVDNDDIAYYIEPTELLKFLKRSKFNVEKKRTRVWLTK